MIFATLLSQAALKGSKYLSASVSTSSDPFSTLEAICATTNFVINNINPDTNEILYYQSVDQTMYEDHANDVEFLCAFV